MRYEDGYFWFRNREDASTFIALRENGTWYLPGVESWDVFIFEMATCLGKVSRVTADGKSIDQ